MKQARDERACLTINDFVLLRRRAARAVHGAVGWALLEKPRIDANHMKKGPRRLRNLSALRCVGPAALGHSALLSSSPEQLPLAVRARPPPPLDTRNAAFNHCVPAHRAATFNPAPPFSLAHRSEEDV
jgi:hypothetical protein